MAPTLKLFAVLFLITVIVSSRHHSPKHTLSTSEKKEQLAQQQETLKTELTSIRSDLLTKLKEVIQLEDTKTKAILLEEEILRQESRVTNILVNLIPSDFCDIRYSADERAEIQESIEDSEKTLEKLKESLQESNHGVRNQEAQLSVSAQLQYLQKVKAMVNGESSCSTAGNPGDLKNKYLAAFQTNLQAPNVKLGDMTQQERVMDYYERTQNANNVANCPIEAPYWDGESCIKCERPTPIFNLQKGQCEECQTGDQIRLNGEECSKITGDTYNRGEKDFILLQPGQDPEEIFSEEPDGEECPKVRPFHDGQQCISCQEPNQLYDLENKNCTSCERNEFFDKETHLCMPEKTTNINAAWSSEDPDALERLKAENQNQNVETCPEEEPFFNGTECMGCEEGEFFNLDDKECQQCSSEEEVFDIEERRCVQANFTDNLDAADRILLQPGQDPDEVLAPSNETNGKQCPPDAPFSDGENCIECGQPETLFDFATKQCTSCEEGTEFDTISHTCKGGFYTNPNAAWNSSDVEDTQAELQKEAEDPDKASCPESKPFYDGDKCIDCGAYGYFQMDTSECDECEEEEVFSKQDRECVEAEMGNNLDEIDRVLVGKDDDPDEVLALPDSENAKECPSERPFYNGQECIQCEQPQSIFDLNEKECTACAEGEVLSNETHRCVGDYYTNPDAAWNATDVESVQEELEDAQNDGKTPCPEETPFFDGTECINCTTDGFFDFDAKTCEECPEDQKFSTEDRECIDKDYQTNPQAFKEIIVPEGETPEDALQETEGKDYCPIERPFFNDEECIACDGDEPHFDLETKECKECESGTVFHEDTQQCTEGNAVTRADAKWTAEDIEGTEEDLEEKNESEDYIVCPEKTPYAKEGKCIKCDGSQSYFNIDDNECGNCEDNEQFSKEERECQPAKFFFNEAAQRRIIFPNDTDVEKIKQDNKDTEQCPEDKPFYNDEECIECDRPDNLFDYEAKECTSCPQGQEIDPDTNQCVQAATTTTKFRSNWTSSDIPASQEKLRKENQDPDFTICPAEKPFFDGDECIACEEGEVFNLDDRECFECEEDQEWDTRALKCVQKDSEYQTDIQEYKERLIYHKVPESEWMDQYNENKKEHEDIEDCPEETPFYDGNKCITCDPESSKPYFDLLFLQCAKCESGFKYDEKTHECISDSDNQPLSPNLNNLVTSVFNHHMARRHHLHSI